MVGHPYIVGELACGNLASRASALADFDDLPQVTLADPAEVRHAIEQRRLYGRCLGYVDVHLLVAEAGPKASYVEIVGGMHGLLGANECVNAITRAFLSTPSEMPEQSCVVDLPGVDCRLRLAAPPCRTRHRADNPHHGRLTVAIATVRQRLHTFEIPSPRAISDRIAPVGNRRTPHWQGVSP